MRASTGSCFPSCCRMHGCALKFSIGHRYAVSLVVVIFGALRPTSVLTFGSASWLDLGWAGVYLICTLYAFSWDVRVDWRLGEGKDWLRERRMFRSTSLYYVAIAADFGLRFGWTLTLVPGGLTKVAMAQGGSRLQLEAFKFCIIFLEMASPFLPSPPSTPPAALRAT